MSKQAVCPECGEYSTHEYGHVYSCSVCMHTWVWVRTVYVTCTGRVVTTWKHELI